MTKTERLRENRRQSALANKELQRAEKLQNDYHNSPQAKRLAKNVQKAIDLINKYVDEWNDIILEDAKAEGRI